MVLTLGLVDFTNDSMNVQLLLLILLVCDLSNTLGLISDLHNFDVKEKPVFVDLSGLFFSIDSTCLISSS